MLLKKSLLILSSLLVLSNCSPNPEVISSVQVIKTTIDVKPRPRPVYLQNVSFKVVTKENIDIFLKTVDNGGGYVFVAFTVKDYEKLSLNIDELRRFISQQESLIVYYENANSSSTN